ncbi:MAG: GNAT family N-acetyltransferase [Candidatus Lindowbacteria bacterium]|nr:GNAT family N-acetyltransferase [Candidatus Lindowbacteria bacterium]
MTAVLPALAQPQTSYSSDATIQKLYERSEIVAEIQILMSRGGYPDKNGVSEWDALAYVTELHKGSISSDSKIAVHFRILETDTGSQIKTDLERSWASDTESNLRHIVFLDKEIGLARFLRDKRVHSLYSLVDEEVGIGVQNAERSLRFMLKWILPLDRGTKTSRSLWDNRKNRINPYTYVWNRGGSVSGMRRFYKDVNGDGRKDLFLAANSLPRSDKKNDAVFYEENGMHEKGRGPYHVFLILSGKYRYVGKVAFDYRSFEILETKHFGLKDIHAYRRGAGSGRDVVYTFNGKKFVRFEDVVMVENSPSEREEAGFAPVGTTVELESIGTKLSWSPSDDGN